jgi:Fe-S cluster biogenesis protein NfuA
MTNVSTDQEFAGKMQKLQTLLHDLETFPDPAAREKMAESVQSLMDFHGAGFARIIDHLQNAGDTGTALLSKLGEDELVSSLLLLYGLHPLELESRVKLALEKVRPYLKSHGGNVQLLHVEDGIVHLEMQGSCHGCPSSAATLKNSIEEAIYEKAPDVVRIDVIGVTEPEIKLPVGFVPIEQLTSHLKGDHHENLQQQTAGGCACRGH